MAPDTGAYPVRADLDAPLEIARWRPLVQWILAFPHLLMAYVLGSVAGFVVFIAWFAILFTGKFPPGLFQFLAMQQRYQWRAYSYAAGLLEPYPPFEFEMVNDDPGGYPATYSIEAPEQLSRGLIFVKWLLAIPHYIVLLFLGMAAFLAWIVGVIAVLFTGAWPAGIRDFLVGVNRWTYRVTAYLYLMRDEYPPFALT
jgi:hypothetical protein